MDPSPRNAQPTKGDVATALALGVVTGALLTTAMAFAMSVSTSGSLAFFVALVAFVASVPAWLVGLCLLGGPLWWWLHRRGVRSPKAGAAAGAVLTGLALAAALPSHGHLLRADIVTSPWAFLAGLVAIGALVGLQTIAFAYRARA
ncbi:hypothetical protein [Caulobacter endophyticus]|uniref:Uncharacterized protein n=1 Tax=Caulobacter endophyticus TaxID=2172652 RepID=A0A2T9K260_9CAUL|nr:hypothetical protein [Caulobacter endophyticus]PVM90069.1 hypothetical protein DDF67_10685 [Caulobacter endophyticus]